MTEDIVQKDNPAINVPKIRKTIREDHTKFIDTYGPSADKVTANRRLQLHTVWTRILLVTDCFISEHVIDDYQDVSTESTYFMLRLDSNVVADHIYIITDGARIIFTDSGFKMNGGLDGPFVDVLYNVSQDYNWEEFAVKLLSYIHETIYVRKKAIETLVFGSSE